MKLSNDFKISFCNAYSEIVVHNMKCAKCNTYLEIGEGDLCGLGKDIISKHMVYADTNLNIKEYEKETK